MSVSFTRSPRRRPAFTLVELLVVIAIIGILIAMLMPSLQGARESGRLTQCKNHIGQLSKAFRTHHSIHNFYPSAGGPGWWHHMTIKDGVPAIAPFQHGGWGYQILPHIDALNVWEGGSATNDMDRSIVAISTPNSMFFCPTRREPEVVEAQDWYHNKPDGSSGNSGRRFGHAKNDYAAASLDSNSQYPSGIGAVTRMHPRNSAHIRDGETNTLLLGEKRINLTRLGQMQANDNEGYTCGWNHDIMRYTNREPRPDFNFGTGIGEDRFGSSHQSGFVVTMVGGSAHLLSYSIDLTTFQRLGHRDDGQAVQLP